MRQPDGRPRGFGYVTLDSPAAAKNCLREAQDIDGRIVDMKLAVPEGSGYGSAGPSPKGGFHMGMFGHDAFGMDMFTGHGYGAWPDAGAQWWSGSDGVTSPTGQGLDCLDLLSAAREFAVSNPSSPHGLPLQHMGFITERGSTFEDEPPSTLLPPEFQQPGAAAKMSASAPEFVPGVFKTYAVSEADVSTADGESASDTEKSDAAEQRG